MITLKVTEKQLNLIKRGMEAIARAGTKQYDYALENLDPNLFMSVGGVKTMWEIRDFIREKEACPLEKHASLGIGNASEDARIAYDMYQSIDELRNPQRGSVRYSQEKLIEITKVDE